jgi:hypothetical protein
MDDLVTDEIHGAIADDRVAYPTSDVSDAANLNAVLDELKEDFIQKMWPTVEKMEWETDAGAFTDSDEGLVMDALAVFDIHAKDYRADVRVKLNDVEINDGSTPKMPMNASKILVWMMGVSGTGASDGVDELVLKFDKMLAGPNFDTMRTIIKSHDIAF